MPRDIPVGNGNLLISFDQEYHIRDVYYPYVGMDNHTKGDPWRFGVWVDGDFSWVGEGWESVLGYRDDTLVTEVRLYNKDIDIELICNDLVDFQEDIYIRRVYIRNPLKRDRDVRLFFHHDLHISGTEIGDTAYFDPKTNSLIHYKGNRYFAISACCGGKIRVDQFSVGIKEAKGMEGTWRDAEDGVLEHNPIAQGSVDSTLGINLKLSPSGETEVFYTIAAGLDYAEIKRLNRMIVEGSPEGLFDRTTSYWRGWVNKEAIDLSILPEGIRDLFKKSLLIIRSQIDNRGAVIAANDSDIAQFNRDTYSYMWPRDGALVTVALEKAGYEEIGKRFFDFCNRVILEEGYLLHKYNPDGSLGSSWHPWIEEGTPQLPIQEDETALVLWALWHHYERYRDIEFVKNLYPSLIIKAADFLDAYRSERTGLPFPSYDLWEERRGVLTFTSSAVYAGLMAASRFCSVFGDQERSKRYTKACEEIKRGIERYLYIEADRRFARMVNFKGDSVEIDNAVDASLFGVFKFGVLSADDERVVNTMKAIEDRLLIKTRVGGVARYENDIYHRSGDDSKEIPGNPWFICTLWLAEYYIERAGSAENIERAVEILQWVYEHALPSGVLSEQIDPHTGSPLSVSPLTWSHATFVMTVLEYLEKIRSIESCAVCGRPKNPS